MSESESFKEKLAYWRENGLTVTYQGGRRAFHDDPSIRFQEKEIVEGAKKKGMKIERKR